MSLFRPVAEWPLILCGPMLRRVTPREVCVFVALRQPALVQLLLFDSGGIPLNLHEPPWHTTLALGERLHVLAASAAPDSPMIPGQRYHYDLRITRLRGGVETTQRLGEIDDTPIGAGEFSSDGPPPLDGPFPLGYEKGKLPGFRIATDLAALALMHASCRKPHGEGPDMLALADDLLVERGFHWERPHQLVLSGDQIYADDVALLLARSIAALAPELITSAPALRIPSAAGYHGELPPTPPLVADDPPGRAMNDASLAPGPLRARYCREVAGFSTTENEGHLLYLAEFYAMYLLAWSPELWPRSVAGEADFEESTLGKRLKRFYLQLPKVRRALANIPTLMLFDDHEVSDDWDMSQATVSRILAGWGGRQVIRNALCAYAVFQDWGNRPADYAAGTPGAQLLDTLACAPAPTGVLDPPQSLPPVLSATGGAQRAELFDRCALRTAGTPLVPAMEWHYWIAFPSHLLIALDTRTRRLLPADGGPAGIIDPAHLAAQLDAPRLAHPSLQAIVVAPGPVFDLPPTELLKDGASQAHRIAVGSQGDGTLYEFLDRETWSGHRGAFAALLRHLLPFGRVVLLSGDIHYAFSNEVALADGSGARVRILQLCSSAAHNEDAKTRLAMPAVAPLSGTLHMLVERVDAAAFPLAAHLQQSADAARALGEAGRALLGELQVSLLRLLLAEEHDIVPALPLDAWRGAPDHAALAALELPANVLRLRIRHLVADASTTPPGMRPCTGNWVPAVGGSASDGGPGLSQAQAVGVNNVGLVQFPSDAQLSHTLFWYSRADSGGTLVRLWCTEHLASLAPPTTDEI